MEREGSVLHVTARHQTASLQRPDTDISGVLTPAARTGFGATTDRVDPDTGRPDEFRTGACNDDARRDEDRAALCRGRAAAYAGRPLGF
jgi:hypothetical protein